MTVIPINAAAAVLLDAKARGVTPLVPVTGIAHPVLARLLVAQLQDGSISNAAYEGAERETGWTRRHIQRQLKALREQRAVPETARPRFELTVHHKQVILACSGNVQLAYDQLVEAGETLPAYATFWRRWNELAPSIQRYARKGASGLVDFWLYPPYEAPERNAVWQADHFELPVDVVADGHTTTLVKPWLTVFEDDATRKMMAWALTATPGRRAGADVVCAAIASGVRIRLEDGHEVGGVPLIIRWDNDLSFTAGMVTQLGVRLGFECHAVPPYSGHMKGKVERFGRRIQEEFCVAQPGYTHGPKTWTGKDPYRHVERPLTAAELRARLELWFAEYDRCSHDGLGGGRTPLSAWVADTTPLRRATDTELRSALLVAKSTYTIHKRKGVHFNGTWWMGAGMLDHVGRKVEVRYPINDDSFIELYRNGAWVCTAWPAKHLTEGQKTQVWARRQDIYAEVRDLQDSAARLRAGASARAGTTDATPSAASMPAEDQLAANAEDLWSLLGGDGPTEDESAW